jgi:alanine dehydrogenase
MPSDPALARGLYTYDGHIAYRPLAEAQGLPHRPIDQLL